MWIYIAAGIVIFVLIASFTVTGILFFGMLHRTLPQKKGKSQIDTDSLFPAMEAYKETIDAGRDWFLSKTRREADITADDGIPLHAEILEAENAVGTVLLMHGYRGTGISNFAAVFRFYHEHGYNIVVPDERACGKSGGSYITLGVKESRDCKCWTEWIKKEFGASLPIFLDGISMGATTVLMATALDLPDNVRGVIADCGFTSPWEIVCAVLRATGKTPVFPFAHIAKLYARIFAGFGLREASSAEAMKSCKIPVFFAHGKADRFVPYEMTEKNFASCAAPKELFTVDEAEHGMCYLLKPKEYEEKILAFFARCLKTENTR